jgi:hypothetical protein
VRPSHIRCKGPERHGDPLESVLGRFEHRSVDSGVLLRKALKYLLVSVSVAGSSTCSSLQSHGWSFTHS